MRGETTKKLFAVMLAGCISYGMTAYAQTSIVYDASVSKAIVSGSTDKVTRLQMNAAAPDGSVYYSDFKNDTMGDFGFEIPIFKDSMQGLYCFSLSSTNADGAKREVTSISIPGIEGDGYTLNKLKVGGNVSDKTLKAEINFSEIKNSDGAKAFIAVYKKVTSIKDGNVKENSLVNVALSKIEANKDTELVIPDFVSEQSDNDDDSILYYAKVFIFTENTLRPLAWSYEIIE